MTVYTIYRRTDAFPYAEFVLIRRELTDSGIAVGKPELFDTLAEVRSRLPKGLKNEGRRLEDDPEIVESWRSV